MQVVWMSNRRGRAEMKVYEAETEAYVRYFTNVHFYLTLLLIFTMFPLLHHLGMIRH